MTRLGPLTSQALGRSPYDDVVDGEGEADPREPERTYDEKGRIYNSEIKGIIKSLIRAHNELMQVIGVAEPEHGVIDEAEDESAKGHHEFEQQTGLHMLYFGRTLLGCGIWGVHGVRQRLLVYRPYSSVEFIKYLHFERTRHSWGQLLFAGVPSWLCMHGVFGSRRLYMVWVDKSWWARAAVEWIRFHLHLFKTLQLLDLVPASQLLPHIGFFIPFTSSSPIAAPPPLERLSLASLGQWVGTLAANALPYAAMYLCGELWIAVHHMISPHIRKYLPGPKPNKKIIKERRPPPPPPVQPTLPLPHPMPESPTLGPSDHEILHPRSPEQEVPLVAQSLDHDIPTLNALEGQGEATEPGIVLPAIRRQGTFSSHGGDIDYGTDDEDADMINPTLISFDVDTSDEAIERPVAGVWSAELRPSYASYSSAKPEPVYVYNTLTNLPLMFASDILANFATFVLMAPAEAVTLRMAARAFARRLPPAGAAAAASLVAEMWSPALRPSLSWRGVINMLCLEMVKLGISLEVWWVTSVLSQWLHVGEDEWKQINRDQDEEDRRARES